jgi:hypothetical protein
VAGWTDVNRLRWPAVLDRQASNVFREADWLLVDIGPRTRETGIPAYVHGQFVPSMRAKRVTAATTAATSPLEQTLFGAVDVGYARNIIRWTDRPSLLDQLRQQLVVLNEPVDRITTFDEAERYFRSASLRKEAVFLSYANGDRDFAAALSGELRKRFQTVFDYRQPGAIRGGQPWLEEVFGQLAQSAVGIALLSESYLASGNCMHEAEELMARHDNGKLRFLTIAVSDATLALPPWMGNLQYLRPRNFHDVAALGAAIVESLAVAPVRARVAAGPAPSEPAT